MRRRTKGYRGFTALGLTALCAWQIHAWAGANSRFPEGYDAVQTAPDERRPGEPPFLRVEIKVGK